MYNFIIYSNLLFRTIEIVRLKIILNNSIRLEYLRCVAASVTFNTTCKISNILTYI